MTVTPVIIFLLCSNTAKFLQFSYHWHFYLRAMSNCLSGAYCTSCVNSEVDDHDVKNKTMLCNAPIDSLNCHCSLH